MTMSQRIGWRSYVSPLSSLLTSIYGVWNAEQSYTVTSLNTSVYGAWNGENTLNDSLGNYNGTNNGVTYTTGKVGSNAFNFNGSSYFTLANDALKFTGNFSISAWVNLNLGASTAHSIVTSGIGTNSGYRLYVHSNGKIYFEYTRLNGQGDYIVGASTLVSNTWYHISIVNNGTSFNLYLNGEPEPTTGSTYQTILWSSAGTNISQIGKYAGLAWYMTGKMDALTVWDRSLSYAEVNALYNSGNGCQYSFPSSISGTISSYGDVVGTNHGTSPATSAPTFTTGKFGKAFRFDGVNDHILLPSTALKFTGDFSVSLWVYIPIDKTTNQTLIGCLRQPSGWRGWDINIYSNRIYFEAADASSLKSYAYITSANIGSWKHVVATFKNGTGGKLYVDNVLRGSFAMTNPIAYDSTDTPTIGCMNYAPGTTWFVQNGLKMDAISTWTKELTDAEITTLYNSGNGKQYPNY